MTVQSDCMRRDIKPENFLLTEKGEAAQLKLCDFGLSSYWKPGVRLQSIVGSCYYVAPEVGRQGHCPALPLLLWHFPLKTPI